MLTSCSALTNRHIRITEIASGLEEKKKSIESVNHYMWLSYFMTAVKLHSSILWYHMYSTVPQDCVKKQGYGYSEGKFMEIFFLASDVSTSTEH